MGCSSTSKKLEFGYFYAEDRQKLYHAKDIIENKLKKQVLQIDTVYRIRYLK